MPTIRTDSFKYFVWLLLGVVLILAITAWGQGFHWQWRMLTPYILFPFFGLVAFSTMWSQYVVGALHKATGVSTQLSHFWQTTGFIVLVAIVFHPSILIVQLWRDGFGLPPESYLQHYVAPSLRWVALLGTVSLFVFLAYEFRRKFGGKKWWRYMDYVVDAAVVAVYYHASRLGVQTESGWYQKLWYFYGITLGAALVYSYYRRFHDRTATK
ncbi:MAG TPA: hypothetical protein VJR27_05465 [Candidatus Saccharimonadales bacterium]|nr:hypothetical protein [Candidatus Saccharimonadales bacterium]